MKYTIIMSADGKHYVAYETISNYSEELVIHSMRKVPAPYTINLVDELGIWK